MTDQEHADAVRAAASQFGDAVEAAFVAGLEIKVDVTELVTVGGGGCPFLQVMVSRPIT
jgi:hypothetical protein